MEELIIRAQETENKLIQDINESDLPAFILEPIIDKIHAQILKAKEEQYQQAKANQEQKKEKKKEDK